MTENEIKYPVKYAVLKLELPGGYIVDYKPITQGYIVEKCYVIESTIKYNADGTSKLLHKVVFPYKNLELFKQSLKSLETGKEPNIGTPQKPVYDALAGSLPIDTVDSLFDTYKIAKEYSNKKNEDYFNKIIKSSSYTIEENERKRKNFDERLEICNMFEELVREMTRNMDVSIEHCDNKIKILEQYN